MSFRITPAGRASFQRCRRQWDFSAPARRNLEPLGQPRSIDLGMAIREALDVYYFPGMWDWPREITLPLVGQGLERALARQRERCAEPADEGGWCSLLETGHGILARYAAWAPEVDQFSPVLVQADFDVHVLDPDRPSRGLVTASGEAVRYCGRIDLLAVDAHDAYWIVRHSVVSGDWPPAQSLIDDEEAVTACWAWEQFYLGMAIAGTVHNEVRTGVPAVPGGQPASTPDPRPASRFRRWLPAAGRTEPRRIRQHEPSGGGRSIPQHRRMYAVAREPERLNRVEQHVTAQFRRTWVRRGRAEVAEAGRALAEAAGRMADPGVTTEPSPAPDLCRACPYAAPCQAMMAGRSAEPLLAAGYRARPPEKPEEGRLGGASWGMGRGAAPPGPRGRFPGPRR